MRKLIAGLVILAVLSTCVLSYGALNRGHHVLVYKGSMKATRTIFDAASTEPEDLNRLLSGSSSMYLVMDVCDANGRILDSNSVLINRREKTYQLYPDAVTLDPCDPNHHVLIDYSPLNSEFFMVGKGKLGKIYEPNRADANTANKIAVVSRLKGAGICEDFNAVGERISGSLAISLKLHPALTKSFNTDGNNVDNGTNAIVNKLNKKGNYTKIPTP